MDILLSVILIILFIVIWAPSYEKKEVIEIWPSEHQIEDHRREIKDLQTGIEALRTEFVNLRNKNKDADV